MAKGAQAKDEIMKKILSTFERSFIYGKEIRIPMEESGDEVQIKVTLTCAKENVPNPEVIEINKNENSSFEGKVFSEKDIQFSQDEKDKVNSLLKQLGIE